MAGPRVAGPRVAGPRVAGPWGHGLLTMWRALRLTAQDVVLVAAKDLRVEWRTRSVLGHIVPFAGLVLVLFGFTLDANRPVLEAATPGLFWMTALFAAVVAVQRSTALEASDEAHRMILLSGMPPAAAFAGKAAAVVVQLLAVEAIMIGGVVLLYGASLGSPLLVVAAALAATVGLATAGSLLGAVVAGVRAHQTVLPVLLLPVASPVLIAATRAFEDALGTAAVNGWAWVGLLAGFAVLNVALGAATYGALQEDT